MSENMNERIARRKYKYIEYIKNMPYGMVTSLIGEVVCLRQTGEVEVTKKILFNPRR
jgi:hypothetical protein